MTLRFVPAIHRATHRIGLSLASLRAHGLSQGEAHILAHLAGDGPATVGDLHTGLSHKRSTLTSILDRLAARGLITRTASTTDRRTFIIATTPKGRALAARVRQHFDAIETAVSRRVTPAEARTFLKVLAAVEDPAREAADGARTRR